MNLKRYIIVCLTALAIASSALASQRAWEEVDRYPGPAAVESITEPEEIAVTARDGYVYITLRHTADVKVFTILGQLIIRQQLRPGVYRFKLGSRGIYLLKAGSLTRRITI